MKVLLPLLLIAPLLGGGGNPNVYTNNWLISDFPGESNDGWGGAFVVEPPEDTTVTTADVLIDLSSEFIVGVENLSDCDLDVTLGYYPPGNEGYKEWLGPELKVLWDQNANGTYEEGIDPYITIISQEGHDLGSATLERFDNRLDFGGKSGIVSRSRFGRTTVIVDLPQEFIDALNNEGAQTLFFGGSLHTSEHYISECGTEVARAKRCEFWLFSSVDLR